MSNPYDVLGIKPDATHDEVREAYRNKVKATHPDAGGDAEEFTRVKAAAVVLLDADKRKQYDDTGTIASDRPNNLEANAMEKIATFFVNSINATLQNPHLNPNDLDLVKGATQWFQQGIADSKRNNADIEKQVKRFEHFLKRLKTKRSNDVLRTMLNNHVMGIKAHTLNNNEQIRVFTRALEILREYEFEAEQNPEVNPYNALLRQRGFFTT